MKLAFAPPPAQKSTVREIESEPSECLFGYRSPAFIPDSIDGNNITLFYQHWTGNDQLGIDKYIIKSYLQPINAKGKKVGKRYELNVPAWKHRLKYDSKKYTYRYFERLSNMVPMGNGRYLYLVGRSFARRTYGSQPPEAVPGAKPKDTEIEALILVLDLKTQTVEIRGSLRVKYGEGDWISSLHVMPHENDLTFFVVVYRDADQKMEPLIGHSTLD